MNYLTGANLSLDSSLVPKTLRHLVTYVEKWGFSDPTDQDRFLEFMEKEKPDEINNFKAKIDASRDGIREWGESLPFFNCHTQDITAQDWEHPYWSFLACIKMREAMTVSDPRTEEMEEARKRSIREGRRIIFSRLVEKADALFRSHEYQKYVSMLEPYVDLLDKTQATKFQFARKHASE